MSYNNDWSNEWADHNQLIDLNERLKKLEAENAKLRECVEFYADLDEEAIGYDIRGVTYARQVLKELEEK